MKKKLQKENQKNSSRTLLGLTPLEHALPAPEGDLHRQRVGVAPMVGLTLADWQSVVARLQQVSDYHNPWRGEPTGWQFDHFYDRGYAPEDALEAWRDWEPWEEYWPPHKVSWPPHDYE